MDRAGVCQKTDTPHTEVFVRIGKQCLGHLTIRRAERVQCPQRTEADLDSALDSSIARAAETSSGVGESRALRVLSNQTWDD